MFTKIVVPLDAAMEAETALPFAQMLARQFGDELVLLSVLLDSGEFAPTFNRHGGEVARLLERRELRAATYLDRIRAGVLRVGISADTSIRTGPVAETILAVAQAEGSGLIAIATHGRGGLERWFLGSVAEEVVRTASIPVLLVRPNEGQTPRPDILTDILVPLDGSSFAEKALPIATALARAFNARITLVRTIPVGWWAGENPAGQGDSVLIPSLEGEARGYLKTTAATLQAEGHDVTSRFALFRAPDSEVETIAADSPAPLVVMTSHGRSGIERVVLGNVADRIVRGSAVPVLVVR